CEPENCTGGYTCEETTRTDRQTMIRIRDVRRRTGALLLTMSLLLAGCAEVTWWEASGDWTGTVTLPGETAAQRTSGIADPVPGQTQRRIRLCQLSTVVLG